MGPRIDGPGGRAVLHPHVATAAAVAVPTTAARRDARAVLELFEGVFRRDVLGFFPRAVIEPLDDAAPPPTEQAARLGPDFAVEAAPAPGEARFRLFGRRHRLHLRHGPPLGPPELRLVRAVASVLARRYEHLFEASHPAGLELFRGGGEDHYVAAYVDPAAYAPGAERASRIASTILTLRTAALSTYENRRVSTGALLMGPGAMGGVPDPGAPADALDYGVELTALRALHRLCDGRRTLFLVDRAGKLAEIIDVARWADAHEPGADAPPDEPPCARMYHPHARATRSGGHVCLVLSPNQEIKLFAEGRPAFAFTHGRWRILDPASKYAAWAEAVASPSLARTIFQAALDMAEARSGGLFVVVRHPEAAAGRLIARHDLLDHAPPAGALAPVDLALAERDPLARRALHYLARGRRLTELDATVIEALASLDGAIVADRTGRLLAFGAILRHHDAPDLSGLGRAEGARTTAALVASLHGPVLKVSEDGIISCFLDGSRAWDL